MQTTTKIYYVFKRLLNKIHTSLYKEYYEEFNGKFNLHKSDIWIDDIPNTPPGSDTSIIKKLDKFILTKDVSVNNNLSFFVYKDNQLIKNFIPPKFNIGYSVRIYDNNNVEIPTAHEVQWLFDYDNGILVFEKDPTQFGFTLPLKISGYYYTGRTLSDSNLLNPNIVKFYQIIGNNIDTEFIINHNLNTINLIIQVYDLQNNGLIFTDIEFIDNNNIKVSFSNYIPTNNNFLVVCL